MFNKVIKTAVGATMIIFLGTQVVFGQIVENPSFEGVPAESFSPPGWYGCNIMSTPDTQPGAWSVDTPPSHGNTYISLVTRGNNNDSGDGLTEAIGTRLLENFKSRACYKISLDLAYFARFDDGFRQGAWKPIKLSVWVSMDGCSKSLMLWKSEVVSHEDWRNYAFNFSVDQTFPYLILEATYADNTIYNGNILIDNLQISKKQVEIDDAILCDGETSIFQVDFPGSTIEWSTGATGSSVEINQAGTYWVNVINEDCIASDTFNVSTPEPFQVELGRDITKCFGDSVTLDASKYPGAYMWNTGSNRSNITVKSSGIYNVKVDNGCYVVEDDIEVTFAKQCCLIEAPNVFTPNNDNLNDLFELHSEANIGKFDLKIYNRWGKLIYESAKVDKFWDGNLITGTEASTGVYYWTIVAMCIDKDEILENTFKGTVTLLR